MSWLMISQIYPASIRGKAMAVSTVANWHPSYLTAVTFLSPGGMFS